MKIAMIALIALLTAMAAGPAIADEDIPRVLSADEQIAQSPMPPSCGPLDDAVKALAERYHEVPAASMLSDSGVMVAIFAAPDGSTFTIMAVQPNGIACETLSGTTFAISPHKASAAPGRES